ncbi:MAG TPA: diguanylate cyclase [Solirubrobacteraceae bacterium]
MPLSAPPELSLILDDLPEAVFTVDARGRWTFLSSAFEQLTGIPVAQALGRSAAGLHLAGMGPGDRAGYAAMLAGELDGLRLVHPYRRAADAPQRWLEVRAQASRDAEGRPAGAAGILPDVTERLLAERHARAEQAVTAMLVADHPAEHAVQALLGTLGAELEWDAGELWTHNADAGVLRCTQVWSSDGFVPDGFDPDRTHAPGDGLPGQVWAQRAPVWVDEPAAGLATGVGFPVVSGDRPLAVLTLFSRARRTPAGDLLPMLARVGAHAGAFIDRKIAQRRMAEQSEDLAVLGRVAHRLAEQTDGPAARRAICEAARDVAGADTVMLFEPDAHDGALVLTESVALAGGLPPQLAIPLAHPASATVTAYRTGRAQFVARLDGAGGLDRDLARLCGVRSAAWQPIVREGAPVGVIAVGWRAETAELPDRVPGMLQVLAADAAVAFERAALLERLTSMALSDVLTGVTNRRGWERELQRELARAARYSSPLCLALLDLDHFKRYNDAHGHQAGDDLLAATAAAWRVSLRPTDLLARYGGEEFAVLLPHTAIADASAVVERLRAATPMRQTCSAGLVSWDGSEDAAGLVRRADVALYDAKAAGRDRTVTALPVGVYSVFAER